MLFRSIYRQLFIDNIKKWVVIEQQISECEAKLKKQRYSQLNTREQSLLKLKNIDLTKEWQNCYLYHDHYIYKLTDKTVFHARDSIMAVCQIEIMEVNKNEVVYKKKIFKYEVCVKDSFSKETAVKSISQEWLEENIAIEYW